jgi:hypothetical protein
LILIEKTGKKHKQKSQGVPPYTPTHLFTSGMAFDLVIYLSTLLILSCFPMQEPCHSLYGPIIAQRHTYRPSLISLLMSNHSLWFAIVICHCQSPIDNTADDIMKLMNKYIHIIKTKLRSGQKPNHISLSEEFHILRFSFFRIRTPKQKFEYIFFVSALFFFISRQDGHRQFWATD